MRKLSPIDVEYLEKKFKDLSTNIDKAANFLIPDAYEMEKEQLMEAKNLVDKHFTGFNEVLNLCSAGVLFSESALVNPLSVEENLNNTVVSLLWSCQDTISEILILNGELNDYVNNMSFLDPMVKKLDQFEQLEIQFNEISDDLEECSKLIISVLTKLDGYNI